VTAIETLDAWLTAMAAMPSVGVPKTEMDAWRTIRGQVAAYEKRIATLQAQLAASHRVVLRLGGAKP
jgi:hypothetical protein